MQKSKSLGSRWSCACAQLPHLGSTVGMKRVILSSLSRERIWITFHNYNCNNDFCIRSISLYFTPIVPGKFSLPHWYANSKSSGNFRPPSPTCLDLAVNPFTINGLSGCPILIFCPNGRYKRAGSISLHSMAPIQLEKTVLPRLSIPFYAIVDILIAFLTFCDILPRSRARQFWVAASLNNWCILLIFQILEKRVA